MCRRVLFCVVLLVPAYLSAFNLNTRHASVFWDPDTDVDSYFGFSIALRKYNGQSWVIVGAPRKNDSRRLHEPGNIFQCGLFRNPPVGCSRLALDIFENARYPNRLIHHKKDYGWMGAAIDVQNNGSRLVACGPRWKNQYYERDYLMNGICYWTDTANSNIEQQLLPLSTISKQGFNLSEGDKNVIMNYYVYGEAGMSVHIPKDSNELIIGAPGLLEWKGTVIRYKDSWRSAPQVPNPLKMQQIEYEGYFGYSVSSGHFYSNESGHQYVGAAPRSELYIGTVLVFKYNDQHGFNEEKGITLLSKLMGQQMGEYFGASLAALDMNGDGLDDIAVGAPMHSFFEVDEHSYDLGQVYAFTNKDKGEWSTPLLLKESQKPGSRFGSALANLGDINRDGYEDLAVGAPYEYGGGAVYIFLGSATGLDPKPSQTLFGKNFETGVPIQSFGISIARGFDVDQNYYNDVAVGAYVSGTAVVLRTHPVVKFTASLNTSTELVSHIDRTALTVIGCIAYQGYKVTERLKANLTMKIDDRQRRAILTEYNDTVHDFQMELRHNVISCKTFSMAIHSDIRDIQRPIQLEMMYGLAYNPLESSDDEMCADCPVLNPNEPKSVRKQVRFATGCRNDLCETDLKVDVVVPEIGDTGYLVLGNMSKLSLQVTAQNLGEAAFVAQLLIAYPRTIIRIRTPPLCEPAANDDPAGNITRLICELGNPFKPKAQRTLDLRFSLQDVPPETDTLLINVTITSLSKEINEDDNQHLVNIKILQSADVTIRGTSGKEQIDYLYSNKSFIQDLTFTHTYEAWNLGPSPVSLVELNFWIPVEYLTTKGDIISVLEIYDPKPTLISPSGNKSFECKFLNGEFIRNPDESNGGSGSIPLPGFGENNLNLPTELEKDLSYIRQRRAARNPTLDTHSNKTLYINCSTGGENSLCSLITCRTGPLLAHSSRAVLTFKMRAMLHEIESELDQKNVIIVGTRGDVKMINPPSDVQPDPHRPDTAQTNTMFLGKVPEGGVASWIIIMSILCGLLILLIITTAMHKAGFFKRQKKEELEAMLQDSDEPNGDVPDNIADTEPITP